MVNGITDYRLSNTATGNISNVVVGSIKGSNIRGDVLYMTHKNSTTLSGVKTGNVTGANILRNVVSITGGRNIEIGNVTGTQVGMLILDIEAEPSYGPVDNVAVQSVIGQGMNIANASATVPAENIRIKYALLDPTDYVGSTPAYGSGGIPAYATQLRNAQNVVFDSLTITNCDGAGINVIYGVGELGVDGLTINHLLMSNCGLVSDAYNTYIRCNSGDNDTNVVINNATIDIQASRSFLLYSSGAKLKNITKTGDGTLLKYTGHTELIYSSITGGVLVQGSSNLLIDSVTFSGTRLSTSGSKIKCVNSTITASDVVQSASTDILVEQSTINTIYYKTGIYSSDDANYVDAITIGGAWLFVDVAGNLKIHTAKPTADTDGVVVGTQT